MGQSQQFRRITDWIKGRKNYIEKHICIRIWGEELLVSMKVFWKKITWPLLWGIFALLSLLLALSEQKKKHVWLHGPAEVDRWLVCETAWLNCSVNTILLTQVQGLMRNQLSLVLGESLHWWKLLVERYWKCSVVNSKLHQ